MHTRLAAALLLAGVCLPAAAQNMGPLPPAGPAAGETVPPLETVLDECTRTFCSRNMALN